MDELTDIYKRIEYLRNNGVKMKEIADRVDIGTKRIVRLILQRTACLHRPAENPHTGRGIGRRAGTSEQCVEKTLIK